MNAAQEPKRKTENRVPLKSEREHYTSILSRFIRTEGVLSTNAKLLHIILADRADRSGVCFPSVNKLAKELGKGVRVTYEALDELVEKGLISRETNGHVSHLGASNLYTVLPEVGGLVQKKQGGCTDTAQEGCADSAQEVSPSSKYPHEGEYKRGSQVRPSPLSLAEESKNQELCAKLIAKAKEALPELHTKGLGFQLHYLKDELGPDLEDYVLWLIDDACGAPGDFVAGLDPGRMLGPCIQKWRPGYWERKVNAASAEGPVRGPIPNSGLPGGCVPVRATQGSDTASGGQDQAGAGRSRLRIAPPVAPRAPRAGMRDSTGIVTKLSDILANLWSLD